MLVAINNLITASKSLQFRCVSFQWMRWLCTPVRDKPRFTSAIFSHNTCTITQTCWMEYVAS